MMTRVRIDQGFSLVEVVIAMLLLAIVAVSILPPLWQGLQFSSRQSAVATATRELNSLVEQARQTPSCAVLTSLASSRTFTDGAGRVLTSSGTVGACVTKSATTFKLVAVDAAGQTLAQTSALIYIP